MVCPVGHLWVIEVWLVEQFNCCFIIVVDILFKINSAPAVIVF